MLNLIVALGIALGLIIIIIILGYKTPVFRRGVKNSLILFIVGLIMLGICFWAVNAWQKGHNVPWVIPLVSGVIGFIFTATVVLRIMRWIGEGVGEGRKYSKMSSEGRRRLAEEFGFNKMGKFDLLSGEDEPKVVSSQVVFCRNTPTAWDREREGVQALVVIYSDGSKKVTCKYSCISCDWEEDR